MTDCKMKSVVDGNQGQHTLVETDVDTSKTDVQNLDDHIDDVIFQGNTSSGVSVTTEWPGLPAADKVTTTRAVGESVRSWMNRHEANCQAALLAHPIDC